MKINIIPKYMSHTDYMYHTNKYEIIKQDNLSARTCGIYINDKLTFKLPGEEIVHDIQNFMSVFLIKYNDNFKIINIKPDNEAEDIKYWETFETQLEESEKIEFFETINLIDINNKTLIWLLTFFKDNIVGDDGNVFKLTGFKIGSFLKVKDIMGE